MPLSHMSRRAPVTGRPARLAAGFVAAAVTWGVAVAIARQPPPAADAPPPPPAPGAPAGPPGGFPGGFPGGGPPGFGGELALVERFDTDSDGRLDRAERQAAREAAQSERPARGGRGGPGRGGPPGGGPFGGGPFGGGPGRERAPAVPGPRMAPDDVEHNGDADLYDLGVLRTLFLEFEGDDWEQELADFNDTDVEVPARLTVDGRSIDGVGVHFRGASSYFMVPAGFKRSLNIAVDHADPDADLLGYRTLNLLNANGDPSLMSSVLYSHIAAPHLPVPKANFVRVVINGESWGVYVNVEQANKDFLRARYGDSKGSRWKVKGRPGGRGGLEYFGDDAEAYRSIFEIKTKDRPEAWKDLIALCRIFEETPVGKLEERIRPVLDVDEVLWFLALDVALVNSDGYWTRASDYTLFEDAHGVFHVIPHDMNECFIAGGPPGGRGGPGFGPPGGPPQGPPGGAPPGAPPGGPPGAFPFGGPGSGGPGRGGPGFGGPGHGGPDLDPLVGLDDGGKPLRSGLLNVPPLRDRYLDNVRAIARDQLAWESLGPVIARCRALIVDAVRDDTRKLASTEAFEKATDPEGGPGTLRDFIERRRAYLLDDTPTRADH